MIKFGTLLLFIGSFFIAHGALAADGNFLKQIHIEQKGSSTLVHFEMAQEIENPQVEARFLRRTIEWDLSGAKLKKDKMFVDVSGAEINNVYASNHDTKGLRIRINLNNEKTASNYHEQISFIKNKNKMTLVWDNSITALSHNITELSRVYEIKPENMSLMEEHIAKQSVIKAPEEAIVPAEAKSEASTLLVDSQKNEEVLIDETKDEKEIPLITKNAKNSTTASSPLGRIAVGVLAVLALLSSVFFVNKKLNSKRAGAPFNHDSIKVVSQKFLGPKRNLTLVRVSGEYLLLGVTDHNITLIKQLSVVDDEIPELVPQDFKTAVKKIEARDEEIDSQAQEVEDSFSVSSLSDVRKIFHKRKYIDETDV
jgi:flagellar protein FliO/FliZ